ncbi:MAG: ATPase, T2SS/T4P/T4SS family [Holosporales bacterium]|jgi:type IV secretion system protein VirB11
MSTLNNSTALDNPLLLRALEPIENYYSSSAVEEIAINRPGEIMIKKHGKSGWETVTAEELNLRSLHALCRMLANVTEQSFDLNDLPILAATLPQGHRFQAVLGTNVRYEMGDTNGVAICIRRFDLNKKFSLDDFDLRPQQKAKEDLVHRGVEKKRYSDFPYEDLVSAVQHGEAVLISGATSTGKTTFLNALIDFIPRDRRIVTVEDTREVVVPHPNRVHFVVSRTAGANKIGYTHILDTVVRMTPDVIVCGEVSVTNAKSIYRLMTTGHSNFMATIHADSPEMALRAFWQNLTQTDPELDAEAAVEILARSFGRIVQIDRSSGKRIITAVDAPNLVKKVAHEASGMTMVQKPANTPKTRGKKDGSKPF